MKLALNIVAALILLVLPVSAPCSANGFTWFCGGCGAIAEVEGDEASVKECHATCKSCCSHQVVSHERTDTGGNDSPTECPGSKHRNTPDSAYTLSLASDIGIERAELLVSPDAALNWLDSLVGAWIAEGVVGPLVEVSVRVYHPPAWGVVLVGTVRLVV